MLSGQIGGAAPAEYEITNYLFEDIARLPIISNRAQELWLGIQLRATRRLTELGRRSERRTPAAVVQALTAAVERLAMGAPTLDPAVIGHWAAELLLARQDVYRLQHSRLCRRLDTLAGQAAEDTTAPVIYEAVELLALLPDALLEHLAGTPPHELPDLDALPALLPHLDTREYVAWVESAARHARQTLVNGYLRYAVRVARGAVGDGLEFPDLVQHGFLGLMRAAERFDYRVNARFGTYAVSWIWQSIGRSVAEEGNLVRLPVHIREKLVRLGRLIAQRDCGHGDPFEDPAFLHEAGFMDDGDNGDIRAAARKIRSLTLLTYDMLSLDDDRRDTEAVPLEDHVVVALPVDRADLASVVERLWAFTTQRQREVLELRYGLKDGQDRTLEEVGQAFGVTRERIRQIEAKALGTLEYRPLHRRLGIGRDVLRDDMAWSISRPPLPPAYPVELLSAANADNDDAQWGWLDPLLERLPHSHWHAARPMPIVDGGRVGQLTRALLAIGGPAHFTRIVEVANEAVAARQAVEQTIAYNILVSDERVFLLLGEGVFSLVEWERARTAESLPQLPFCPVPLPDPPDFEGALFESVFVAHASLAAEPTASDFLDAMLRWAGADPLAKLWQRQGILATYYLLGLLPYVCIAGSNPRLQSTLPGAGVHELRRYCLQTLTERLVGMPEFWSALRAGQPIRAGEMSARLAELRPDGLDDAARRLRLLSSLGAVVRSSAGYYRLTPLGDACAAAWGREPEGPEGLIERDVEAGDLLAWSLW